MSKTDGEEYYIQKRSRRVDCLHTEEDCNRINGETEKTTREEHPHRSICSVCSGEFTPHKEPEPFRIQEKLLDYSPDDDAFDSPE